MTKVRTLKAHLALNVRNVEPARLAVFRRVRDEIQQRLKNFIAPSPIACDMTAIPQDQRQLHIDTSKELFSRIKEFRELENGYEFRFAPDVIVKLAEFIALEKLCCPFLSFVVEVEEEGGPVWLRLTGREGVKAFIREEIGLTRLQHFAGFT